MITSAERRPDRSPAVLATGIITIDQIFGVDALPRGEGKHHARTFTQIGGGVAANAAVTVATLGGRSLLASCVGDDLAGDTALAELRRAGVDVSRVQRIAGTPTPITAAIVERGGGRVVVNYAPPDLFSSADPRLAGEIEGVAAVVVDCRWPQGAIATLQAARLAGIHGIVDVDRPLTEVAEPILGLASHLVFSVEALHATTRIVQPSLALRALRSRTAAWVAVTEGAGGVSWLDDGGLRHRRAFQVDVVDTLGAGDVFHGAFALALAEGMAEEPAIEFATATAALKCTRAGGRAGIPDRSQVEALLHERQGVLC